MYAMQNLYVFRRSDSMHSKTPNMSHFKKSLTGPVKTLTVYETANKLCNRTKNNIQSALEKMKMTEQNSIAQVGEVTFP